jgi:hypothetical protein
MKKISFVFALACIIYSSASAQFELGPEYQLGFSKGHTSNTISATYEGFSAKNSWNLGINYNFSGAGKTPGIGFHAGYRLGYSFGTSGNLYSGIRVALAFNKNENGATNPVIIPSIETGYHYTFNNFGPGLFASPGIALGYPVSLDGGKTDESPIINTRLGVGFRF